MKTVTFWCEVFMFVRKLMRTNEVELRCTRDSENKG